MSNICGDQMQEKKIDGYDPWKVRNAVTTMRESAEIEADKKFLKVVTKEMNKEAGVLTEKASLLTRTSAKLKAVFGGKK